LIVELLTIFPFDYGEATSLSLFGEISFAGPKNVDDARTHLR